MAAGTAVAVLPASFAKSSIVLASRSRLTIIQRTACVPVRISLNSQRSLIPQHVGLRRVSTVHRSVGEQRVSPQLWQPGHHECPHCLNPQAGWKQEIVWTKVKVAETQRAAKELVALKVDISNVPELKTGFSKPGQFVQMKVGDGKPTFLAIASPPTLAESGVLEFLIKDVEGTTAAELCALKEGADVEISQVMGRGFPIDKVAPAEDYPSIFIFATGSGISPIRSVIEHGFDAEKRKDVRLYYGAENLEKMAYQDRFEAWEASGVKIIPVLSGAGEEWKGERGNVQTAYKNARNLADPAHTGALLCGQKEMAEEVTSILVEDGVSKDNILLNF